MSNVQSPISDTLRTAQRWLFTFGRRLDLELTLDFGPWTLDK